jgi:hypothetical protein
VVLAPVPSPNPGYPPPEPQLPEASWTASDPAAREFVRDRPTRVFRLNAPMDPEGCTGRAQDQP